MLLEEYDCEREDFPEVTVSCFSKQLADCGYTFVEGITWTADAFYRETRAKVKRKKNRTPFVLIWNVSVCRHFVISGERNFFSFSMPEIIWIIYRGNREASGKMRDWMIKQSLPFWRLNSDGRL